MTQCSPGMHIASHIGQEYPRGAKARSIGRRPGHPVADSSIINVKPCQRPSSLR